jgi:lysophospholipase L1-like esterase
MTSLLYPLLMLLTYAQPPTSFKFDFGPGAAAPGYIAVTPSMIYNTQTGYGWETNSTVTGVNRGGKDQLRNDFVESTAPFSFSVDIPEGNYNVKVILGDAEGVSSTVIRGECRRWMAGKVDTKRGEFFVVNFTIHVKDTLIRNDKNEVIDRVRIKERERSYLHWDNRLTLEFNGAHPKVCGVEITPNTTATTLFLAGNSTVVDQDREPWASWGQIIPRYFQPDKIVIANYAESGEALNSFISAKRLQKVLSKMKSGDYLFIEFGHNDMKQKDGGAFTTYKKNLLFFISEARKKGGIPVLVTSMHRRSFDSTGHIINTLLDYPAAVRETAKEEKVALIDLNAMSKTLYEAWGVENSLKAFVHYPANSFPNQPEALKDNTHFSTYGASQIANCILKGIQDAKLPIAKYIVSDFLPFDPAQPTPFEKWYWPLSTANASVKPDGN